MIRVEFREYNELLVGCEGHDGDSDESINVVERKEDGDDWLFVRSMQSVIFE